MKRFLGFLLAAAVAAVLLFYNMVSAEAGIGAWLTDVGISEVDAAPADFETFGGAALVALAAGTTYYVATDTPVGQYVSNFAQTVGNDAWNYAKGLSASVLAKFTGISPTQGATITIDQDTHDAIQTFLDQEMPKMGADGTTAGTPDCLGSPTAYTSGSNSYTMIQGTTLTNGSFDTAEMQYWQGLNQNYTYGLEIFDKSAHALLFYASTVPLYAYYAANGGITVDASDAADRGTGVTIGVTHQPTDASGTNTYGIQPDHYANTSLPYAWNSGDAVVVPYTGYTGAVHTTMPYPSNLAVGNTVTLPPVTRTANGDVALPAPVPIPGTNDYGLSGDGTRAIDSTTGATVDISQAATEGTQLSILQQISNFFDMNKPINWSPMESVPFSKKFPFSLPWDLSNGVSALVQPGQLNDLNLQFPMPQALGGGSVPFSVAWPQFVKDLAPVFRDTSFLLFNFGLLWGTRKLIGGDK